MHNKHMYILYMSMSNQSLSFKLARHNFFGDATTCKKKEVKILQCVISCTNRGNRKASNKLGLRESSVCDWGFVSANTQQLPGQGRKVHAPDMRVDSLDC